MSEITSEIVDEVKGCTLLYCIENISHSWLKTGEPIVSPIFTADELKGIKLQLCVYPNGKTSGNDVAFYLRRSDDCSGPSIVDVSYELAFLDKDGASLSEKSKWKEAFAKNESHFSKSESREKVFIIEKERYLPEDTLTVQCMIRCIDETPVTSKLLSARTVFKVIRRSFAWKIEEFSNITPGVRNKFKDEYIDFDIVSNEELDFGKKLVMDVISFDEKIKYFLFKSAIVSADGKKEDLGSHEFFAADLKAGTIPTSLLDGKLLKNKSRYLPNDSLSLDFNYLFSTGTVLYQLCYCGTLSPLGRKADARERKDGVETPNTELASMLIQDLKSMFTDGLCSDTEVRMLTQTFPAHKNILSSRSPVFRRHFSEPAKENNSVHVDITDLEEDTVLQMLLYLYTDLLENLQLENACKLYEASHKYEIWSLKSKCSAFLKINLSSEKVCDVIILADRYKDDDLKIAAQDFILNHDQDVFGSDEWKLFMSSNIELAAEVMYRKVFLG